MITIGARQLKNDEHKNYTKHYGKPLLQIANFHCNSCGAPPKKVLRTSGHIAYFENYHGEQIIFVETKNGNAEIYHGDCAWKRKFTVSVEKPVPEFLVNKEEMYWICLCLTVVMMNKKAYDYPNFEDAYAYITQRWDEQTEIKRKEAKRVWERLEKQSAQKKRKSCND